MRNKTPFVQILLGLWMSLIFILQLLLHPPTIVLDIISKLELLEGFTQLGDLVKPFFETIDINPDALSGIFF